MPKKIVKVTEDTMSIDISELKQSDDGVIEVTHEWLESLLDEFGLPLPSTFNSQD